MAAVLDPTGFPHIADLIVRYSPTSSFPALRLTTRAFLAAVDRCLQEHVVVTHHWSSSVLCPTWISSWTDSPFTRVADFYLNLRDESFSESCEEHTVNAGFSFPKLKYARLLGWNEEGYVASTHNFAYVPTVIVPVLCGHPAWFEDPVEVPLSGSSLHLLKFSRIVFAFPPLTFEPDAGEVELEGRGDMEVVIFVGDGPAEPSSREQNLFGTEDALRCNSSFVNLCTTAALFCQPGSTVTIVGLHSWIKHLQMWLPAPAQQGPSDHDRLHALMARYLAASGPENSNAGRALNRVRFLSHDEWREEVGEEEWTLVSEACDLRHKYLTENDFTPWNSTP